MSLIDGLYKLVSAVCDGMDKIVNGVNERPICGVDKMSNGRLNIPSGKYPKECFL